jgi:hypothetical protein
MSTKSVKFIDIIIQASLASLLILYFIFFDNSGLSFLYIYFITGGYQLLSCILHLFIHASWKNQKSRKSYGISNIVLFSIVGLAILIAHYTYVGDVLILLGVILLFITPIYAIIYFIISLNEWKRIKERELVHLK